MLIFSIPFCFWLKKDIRVLHLRLLKRHRAIFYLINKPLCWKSVNLGPLEDMRSVLRGLNTMKKYYGYYGHEYYKDECKTTPITK